MDPLLIGLQVISVAILAIVGLLPFFIKDNRPTVPGWILLIAVSFIFITMTIIKEIKTSRSEEKLRQQIEEIIDKLNETRDKLYDVLAPQVMEAPKGVSPAPKQQPSIQIQIKEPQAGSLLPSRSYIEGSVSDPHAEVWVIVHPMDVTAYWIQPTVNVKNDGSWKAMIYLGRSGVIDSGKHFEIMAVAKPKVRLSEGDVLSEWPDAQWQSDVITVTRK